MSFGFGVGDFLAVLQLINTLRQNFSEAPAQFKAISEDVRALSIVILDADANSRQLSEHQSQNVQQVVSICLDLLRELQEALKKYQVIGETKSERTATRFWKRLKWEPEEIQLMRSRITAQASILSSLNSQILNENIVKLVRDQDDRNRESLIQWFSNTNYVTQQSDLLSRRQPGSVRWLLNSEEYAKWQAARGSMFFCTGIPGAGKTMAMAVLVNDLQERYGNDPDTIISYMYFTYKTIPQNLIEILCAMLGSALSQLTDVPKEVEIVYETCRAQSRRPSEEKIKQLLRHVFTKAKAVYLMVDALDELPTMLLRQLNVELLQLRKEYSINLFFTSRDIPEIKRMFTPHGAIMSEIRASSEDIEAYLRDNIFQLPRCVTQSSKLQAKVIDEITKASDGMFLLAELHLKSLVDKTRLKEVRTTLEQLSTGSASYDVAYKEVMGRIKSRGVYSETLARNALLIVTCCQRLLAAEELSYALSIEADSEIIDEENVPDIEDVVAVCAGLIVVDSRSQLVHLVHKSTQDYFERTRTEWFPNAQFFMWDLCSRYLKLVDLLAETDPAQEPPFTSYAKVNVYYHYRASEEESAPDVDNDIASSQTHGGLPVSGQPKSILIQVAKDLAGLKTTLIQSCRQGYYGIVELLLSVNKYEREMDTDQSFNWLADPAFGTEISQNTPPHVELQQWESFSACHHLRYWDDWIEAIERDNVPLTIATARQDLTMVTLILRYQPNPNLRSIRGQTALFIAAENGLKEIVDFFLNHESIDQGMKSVYVSRRAKNLNDGLGDDFDDDAEEVGNYTINLEDTHLLTALEIAAEKGNWECWKLLFESQSHQNRSESVDYALWWAMNLDHAEIIEELLTRPEANLKRDLLFEAIERRNSAAAIAMIPHRDLNSSLTGASTLRRAFDQELIEVMEQLLLNCDVCDGRELSQYQLFIDAIQGSRLDAVKILLPHYDVNADIGNFWHGTEPAFPLHVAATVSDGGITEALLTKASIVIDCLDHLGRSPFLLAAEHGNIEPMIALSEYGGNIKYDRADRNSKTAFDHMLTHPKVGGAIFSLLHKHLKFDINEKNSEGQTLLHRICSRMPILSHKVETKYRGWICFKIIEATQLIEAILETPGLDVNARDNDGKTALFWAAKTCNLGAVRVLLQHKNIDLENSNSSRADLPWLETAEKNWEGLSLTELNTCYLDFESFLESCSQTFYYIEDDGYGYTSRGECWQSMESYHSEIYTKIYALIRNKIEKPRAQLDSFEYDAAYAKSQTLD